MIRINMIWTILILAVSLESGNAKGERICFEPETGNNCKLKVMFRVTHLDLVSYISTLDHSTQLHIFWNNIVNYNRFMPSSMFNFILQIELINNSI
jgi:hypothetical protein